MNGLPFRTSSHSRENWSSGAEPLFGSPGRFVLVRGVHRVKLGASEDRVDQLKAYGFPQSRSPTQVGATAARLL